MRNTSSWFIDLVEDPATGDLMLSLPPEVLDTVGWVSGDILNWKDNGDGSWTIQKNMIPT